MMLVLCVVLAAGCSPFWRVTDPQVPAGTPEPGALEPRWEADVTEFHREPIAIQIPSQVERGQQLRVGIRTYGGGCTQKGETRVELEGLTAEIISYDHTATGQPCTMELRFFQHTAVLRFDQAGIARVQVRGGSVPSNEVITVERTVHVP